MKESIENAIIEVLKSYGYKGIRDVHIDDDRGQLNGQIKQIDFHRNNFADMTLSLTIMARKESLDIN